MLKTKNIIRALARLGVTLGLLLVLDLMLGELPDRTLQSQNWDRLDSLGSLGKSGRDVLKIYSVVKFNRTDLTEDDAWDIAQVIFDESKDNAIDPMLILAIIKVESEFRPEAVSQRGARGLMQVLPIVADHLGQKTAEGKSIHPDVLHDPVLNIRLGVSYLSELRKQFRDLRLALTAYNWGPTELQKKLDENEPIPFEYASKVLAAYKVYGKIT
jgi:soluble lytic murein transglycosylase